MSPDANKKIKTSERGGDFVVYNNVIEAIEAGVDKDVIFNQWSRQNMTALKVIGPKVSELMDIWFNYEVPATVILFYLKSMTRIIESETKKKLPVEAYPDFENALKEIDALIKINNKDSEKEPLAEIMSRVEKNQDALDFLYR